MWATNYEQVSRVVVVVVNLNQYVDCCIVYLQWSTTTNIYNNLDFTELKHTDSSHLLSEVLALSWNPFLLVCAITVALFITFASITFALMKYVDFSETFQPSSARGSFVACLSSQSGHNSKANSSSQRDSSCDGSSSNFNEPTTNKTQRARVITLAAANNNSIGDKGNSLNLSSRCTHLRPTTDRLLKSFRSPHCARRFSRSRQVFAPRRFLPETEVAPADWRQLWRIAQTEQQRQLPQPVDCSARLDQPTAAAAT